MAGLLDILGSFSGKTPAAMIDGNEFVLAAQKYGLPTDMDSMNKIVNLVNSGMDVDSAARSLAGKGILGATPKEGGLNATNYPNPYGLRAFPQKGGGYGGEMMPKTTGHMGLIEGLEKDEKGNPIYITEYSSGGDNGNFFYPTVFEGMTPEQINTVKLLEAGKMKWSNPKAIELDKIAKQKGMERKSKGLSPFKDYN